MLTMGFKAFNFQLWKLNWEQTIGWWELQACLLVMGSAENRHKWKFGLKIQISLNFFGLQTGYCFKNVGLFSFCGLKSRIQLLLKKKEKNTRTRTRNKIILIWCKVDLEYIFISFYIMLKEILNPSITMVNWVVG